MLKVATKEDFPIVKDMCLKFIQTTRYKDLYKEEVMDNLIQIMLESAGTKGTIIILNDDKGFIAGMISPFVYSNEPTATELGWWVEPEHRNSNVGTELLEAFEKWAEINKCRLVTMVSLDQDVGTFYEKHDYKLQERAYVKELN